MMGCALRGGHAYVASRRLDGYDTCAQCGHRRKAIDSVWPTDMALDEAESRGGQEAGPRPFAALGCAIRRYHNYMPSRRMEGYETCIQCGRRRKALEGAWFASAPPKASQTDPGPPPAPDHTDNPVIIPFGADRQPAMPAKGVDPRVLRDFLRQIDSGALNPRPGSGRPRGGGGPKPPKA
jgi:hypothetical protein